MINPDLSIQCSTEQACVAIQLMLQRIEQLEKIVDSMKSRLPLWATGGFTVSGLVIGILSNAVMK